MTEIYKDGKNKELRMNKLSKLNIILEVIVDEVTIINSRRSMV